MIRIMLDAEAIMPTRAHPFDAGLDLYARQYGVVPALGCAIFDTGVHVEIPRGWCGLLVSKSGMNVKRNLTSTGLIDSGYTGSIVVKLYNHGHTDQVIEYGNKISQLVILQCRTDEVQVVDSFEDTERGANGFGSTGV